MRRPLIQAGVVAAALIGAVGNVRADSTADFYAGKTITILIGTGAGGGYDQYARTLARHIGNHIPGNPALLPQNMPGAAGLEVTRLMTTVEAKDGTVIAAVHSSIPIMPLLGQATGYDPVKFGWIGNLNKETAVCFSWHTSPVKTFADLQHKEMIVGDTGKGADLDSFERPLINILGAKLKVVYGYKSAPAMDLAVERGELRWPVRRFLEQHEAAQRRLDCREKGELPGPARIRAARGASRPSAGAGPRQVRRRSDGPQPSSHAAQLWAVDLAPPDVPAERLAVLRAAFDATLKDPEFLADAEESEDGTGSRSGEALQKMVQDMYATPPALVARAKSAME